MLHQVLQGFEALIRARLEKGVFTTEDSVRYTFFSALLDTTGLRPEHVILEFPHPGIPRAKIDTWIPDLDGRTMAFEFKYDREIPSDRNSPRTQKAGKVFNDIHRLEIISQSTDADCVFVYLASGEMSGYMSNPQNGISDFFLLHPATSMNIDAEFLNSKATTFRGAVGGEFAARLTCLHSASLPKEHELRVYRVQPVTRTREG